MQAALFFGLYSMKKKLLYVLYDGIENSVFQGQVLTPLINMTHDHEITLLSFETKKNIKKILPTSINYQCEKKYSFLGAWSLFSTIIKLKKVINALQPDTIIARGPLAGYISMCATKTIPVTVQARGLLTEEYKYTHPHKQNMLKNIVHALRTQQFWHLEKKLYGTKQHNITFQAVSPALKHYLINAFNTPKNTISITQHDIPQQINKHQRNEWKSVTRSELNIPDTAHVYCYNGSAKPWQCPQETLTFFKQQLQKNNNSFLLLLTQDTQTFEQLLQEHAVDKKKYCIKKVDHKKIYRYLSAADTGMLFRNNHVVNWTSRPTKLLEYQAVGLNIAHNNTVEYCLKK